jgi:redox-regulated HSP33 family molecular chaperone
MVVDGKVSMTCEFCEIDFDFTVEDLGALELQYAQPLA